MVEAINFKGQDLTISGNLIRSNPIGIEIDYNAIPTQRITISGNDLSGNTLALKVTPAVTETVNASGNWWGAASASAVRAAANGGTTADYTPWLAAGTDMGDPGFHGDFSELWVDDDSPQSGTTGRVQEGINLVSGSTVHLAPGTYTGATTVNQTVVLEGAGNGSDPASSTILNGGGAVALLLTSGGTSSADRLVLRNFRVTGSSNGLRTDSAISHITLEDLVVTGNSSYGLEVHNTATVDDLILDGCSFNGNTGTLGVRVRGALTHFAARDCAFDSNSYGFQSVAGCGDGKPFEYVEFTDCTFNGNLDKGAYFEKLSHAQFTDCEVANSGNSASYPCGIDVNLKYGTYTDIVFTRLRVTNCGTGDAVNGAGLWVKGRNDGSVAPCPASVSSVSVVDAVVSGCPLGVFFGNNTSGITMASSSIYGNTVLGAKNTTDGTTVLDATGCWWGDATGPYHVTLNPVGAGKRP